MKMVQGHNPDVSAVDDQGNTPLHYLRRRPTMDVGIAGGFVPKERGSSSSTNNVEPFGMGFRSSTSLNVASIYVTSNEE